MRLIRAREASMDWRRSDDSAERFSAYLQEIAGEMGHAARVAPMRA
jgi:hypothetical protein